MFLQSPQHFDGVDNPDISVIKVEESSQSYGRQDPDKPEDIRL